MSRVLPILFNTDMVRAILDGRKTVTRRICKDANECTVPDMSFYDADKRTYAVHNYSNKEHTNKLSIAERTCPICPGDILYVRESVFQGVGHYLDVSGETVCVFTNDFEYYADGLHEKDHWKDKHERTWMHRRPSIHMPKEAARIFLKVKGVRVERLQEMETENGKNYIAEGAKDKHDFIRVWDSTVSDREHYGWYANPWVWVIEFERCEKTESEE